MRASPFDHRPDSELGKALKEILSGHDEEAFVRRVMAQAAEIQSGVTAGGDWWEVLSSWARHGLAAAAIGFMLAATIWLGLIGGGQETNAALGDPLQPNDTQVIPAAFLAAQPPQLDQLLVEVAQ
jgi:hypothetical protein